MEDHVELGKGDKGPLGVKPTFNQFKADNTLLCTCSFLPSTEWEWDSVYLSFPLHEIIHPENWFHLHVCVCVFLRLDQLCGSEYKSQTSSPYSCGVNRVLQRVVCMWKSKPPVSQIVTLFENCVGAERAYPIGAGWTRVSPHPTWLVSFLEDDPGKSGTQRECHVERPADIRAGRL